MNENDAQILINLPELPMIWQWMRAVHEHRYEEAVDTISDAIISAESRGTNEIIGPMRTLLLLTIKQSDQLFSIDHESASMKSEGVTCSFCAGLRKDLSRMVAGPGVFICDACVQRCQRMLHDS